MRAIQLFVSFLIIVLVICNLSAPTESKRVLFYNKTASIQKGQLLVSEKRARPCPRGQMRDHRDRCRRVINFGRKN